MAFRLPLRAVPMRAARAALAPRAWVVPAGGARAKSSHARGVGERIPETPEARAARLEAQAAAKAAKAAKEAEEAAEREAAAERARQWEARLIERLKAQHGEEGWKAVFEEGRARTEQRVEAARWAKQRAKEKRQRAHQQREAAAKAARKEKEDARKKAHKKAKEAALKKAAKNRRKASS